MTIANKKQILDALLNYAGGVVKKRLIKMAVEQLIKVLVTYLPFTMWGPLGVITRYFVTKLVIVIIDKTVIGAHVLYIYGDTHFDAVAVRKIITKFKEFEGEMTDEQRDKLDAELVAAGHELGKFSDHLKLRPHKGSK